MRHGLSLYLGWRFERLSNTYVNNDIISDIWTSFIWLRCRLIEESVATVRALRDNDCLIHFVLFSLHSAVHWTGSNTPLGILTFVICDLLFPVIFSSISEISLNTAWKHRSNILNSNLFIILFCDGWLLTSCPQAASNFLQTVCFWFS